MIRRLEHTILILVTITISVAAQSISNPSNNWYFGDRAGLNFNTNPPSALTDGNLNTQEGVASISDNEGTLLFYTDGRRVWDRSHQVLNTVTLNGHNSATQSGLILPNLQNPDIYYIFTVDELARPDGLQYSELNTSLPGNGTLANPLGELVTGKINITLVSPVTEKVNAVLKADTSGYWVITHGWNNDEFYVFSVDCNGVDPVPQTYKIGSQHSGGANNINSVGYLKSNIDGDKLALVNRTVNAIEVFDFDASSGTISNPKLVNITGESLYGIEFSFESKYLYIGGRNKIFRYELSTEILDEIQLTNGTINSSNAIRALQLGPDKKIYVSIRYLSFISAIEDPSSPTATLSVNFLDIDPNNESRNCRFGLPNIFYVYLPKRDTTEVTICSNETYSILGEDYLPNSVNTIIENSATGCDSTYTLKVNALPSYEMSREEEVCPGDSYEYLGTQILAGETMDFPFTNIHNCDSIITISVKAINVLQNTNTTFASICSDESYTYQGVDYLPNSINQIGATSAEGCDSSYILKIDTFPNYELSREEEVCPGDSYEYLGTQILPGETLAFPFTTIHNCDSIITISVKAINTLQNRDTTFASICSDEIYTFQGADYLPNSINQIAANSVAGCDSSYILKIDTFPNYELSREEEVCSGDSYEYLGTQILAGETMTFPLTSIYNCDSIVTISVKEIIILQDIDTTFASICSDESYTYQGFVYPPNSTNQIKVSSAAGCDSSYILKIDTFPNYEFSREEEVCLGDSYEYLGTEILPGETMTFPLTSIYNCDSIVTISVREINILQSTDTTFASICSDELYAYQGVDYLPNSINQIIVPSVAGCDSSYILKIDTFPNYDLSREEEVCLGDSYEYLGTQIFPGETMTFPLTSIHNCDSIITISVKEINVLQSTDTTFASTCSDELYSYQGEDYLPNSINQIIVPSVAGCDSSYILKIDTFPNHELSREVEVCLGDSYEYLGTEILPGETMSFPLASIHDCDSVVTISVVEIDEIQNQININLCPDEFYIINGNAYNYSLDTTIVYPTETCDSLVNYIIESSSEPRLEISTTSSCSGLSEGSITINLSEPNTQLSFSLDQAVYSETPFFEKLFPGVYSIYVKDQHECQYEFQTEVPESNQLGDLQNIYIPNVFNPSDIENSCFRIYPALNLEILEYNLKIYDRWGSLVFESSEITECWDGEFKKVQLEQGVYCWLLNYTENNCTEITTKLVGNLTLLR